MQGKRDAIHYFSELHFISKGLMEVSFNFSEVENKPGEVKDLIYLSFTPTVKSEVGRAGFAVDARKRETMTFDIDNMRSFAEALKLGGVSFLEPARNIFQRDETTGHPLMPVEYRTFYDRSWNKSNPASKQKTVSIKPCFDNDKPYINVVFNGDDQTNVTVAFDPHQARGFGDEVMHQADHFSKELNIYRIAHSSK